MTGPLDPLASKLRATPPSAAYRCWLTKASAPHRQASSASVKANTMSLRGFGPAASARAVSNSVETPAPSSLAP